MPTLHDTPDGQKCTCKESSCKKDCISKHTHKGFFCEICKPKVPEEWEINIRLWYQDHYPGEPSKKELNWICNFIRDTVESKQRAAMEETIRDIFHVFSNEESYQGTRRIDARIAMIHYAASKGIDLTK